MLGTPDAQGCGLLNEPRSKQAIGCVRSNLPALLDEWAGSLFRELDYRQEADNGTRFKALYGALDRVFVPDMYRDFTTQRVLVMEWVTGRRLRTSSEGLQWFSLRACDDCKPNCAMAASGLFPTPFMTSFLAAGPSWTQCIRPLLGTEKSNTSGSHPDNNSRTLTTLCGGCAQRWRRGSPAGRATWSWWRWACGAAWSRCWRRGSTTATRTPATCCTPRPGSWHTLTLVSRAIAVQRHLSLELQVLRQCCGV